MKLQTGRRVPPVSGPSNFRAGFESEQDPEKSWWRRPSEKQVLLRLHRTVPAPSFPSSANRNQGFVLSPDTNRVRTGTTSDLQSVPHPVDPPESLPVPGPRPKTGMTSGSPLWMASGSKPVSNSTRNCSLLSAGSISRTENFISRGMSENSSDPGNPMPSGMGISRLSRFSCSFNNRTAAWFRSSSSDFSTNQMAECPVNKRRLSSCRTGDDNNLACIASSMEPRQLLIVRPATLERTATYGSGTSGLPLSSSHRELTSSSMSSAVFCRRTSMLVAPLFPAEAVCSRWINAC